jgi:hypothetical protein
MKNKNSNDRWSYFLAPRNHGNVRAWVPLASASQKSKRSLESNLRWEDDGGPASETGELHPQGLETSISRRMYAAE